MDNKSNEAVCAHIRVRGLVQGVGFRAHVEHYALLMGIKGWVRNVGWDAVETVAEGARSDIEQFIEMVKRGPRSSRVDEATVEWEPLSGEYAGFVVKHNI